MEKEDLEEKIPELLDAIVWGYHIVEVQKQDFILRPLTLEERNIGNYIYKRSMKRSEETGLSTRKQLTREAIIHDLWKSSYADEIKLLQEELTDVTKELLEMEERVMGTGTKKKRKTPTTPLRRLRDRSLHIHNVLSKLNTYYTTYIELPSSEYKAESERGDYFLHCAAHTFPDMKQIWSRSKDLENETNTTLVSLLLSAYYGITIADESTIRRIARSGIWRCKWMASKKNRGVKTLFNREMYDLTIDQFCLMYWSQIYDSAYEAMEPPSDVVIEDDTLFDCWLEERNQKHEQDQKRSTFSKKISNLKANADEIAMSVLGEYCEQCICGVKEKSHKRANGMADHTHDPSCSYGVFIYYNRAKKQTKVEEVQSTNPERVRRVLAHEQKHLADVGGEGVEEQYLRGDKSRKTFGLRTKVYGPGEYAKNRKL